MLKGLVSIVVSILALGAWALNPTHHLTASDVDRLQGVLEQPFTDLKSAYFSTVGLSKLGVSVPDSDVSLNKCHKDIIQTRLCIACLLTVFIFSGGLQFHYVQPGFFKHWISVLRGWGQSSTFLLWGMNGNIWPFLFLSCLIHHGYLSCVWFLIFGFEFALCQIHVSNETRDLLLAAVSEDSTISQIHQAVSALSSLGLPMASQEVVSALKARMAKEDNVVAWVIARLVLAVLTLSICRHAFCVHSENRSP